MELYLQRQDPAQNMHRFYALSLEPDLFGKPVVVRRWGRIGGIGQSRRHACDSDLAALALLLRFARQKLRRHYRPYSGALNSSAR